MPTTTTTTTTSLECALTDEPRQNADAATIRVDNGGNHRLEHQSLTKQTLEIAAENRCCADRHAADCRGDLSQETAVARRRRQRGGGD